jgi:hypothetical protein
MTNKEAADLLDNLIGMVSDNHDSDYDEALSKGRDILKSEPCEDAISREEVINCFTWTNTKDDVWYAVKALPSVYPKQKTGHWIKIESYPLQEHDYECSECLKETDDNTWKYCPDCGAKMVEPQESEGEE